MVSTAIVNVQLVLDASDAGLVLLSYVPDALHQILLIFDGAPEAV